MKYCTCPGVPSSAPESRGILADSRGDKRPKIGTLAIKIPSSESEEASPDNTA